MNPELIVMRGPPACGKTRWSTRWVERDPHTRARVSRDDLRQQFFGRDSPLPHDLEKTVTYAEEGMVRSLLAGGRSVVVDAMHLRMSYVRKWEEIAFELGARFSVQEWLDEDVEELVMRDQQRQKVGDRWVGEEFIRETMKRYWNAEYFEPIDRSDVYVYHPDENLPPAWMFDIDGTLAHMNGRSPYDWTAVGEDRYDDNVGRISQQLWAMGDKIVILSGRDGSCRPQTTAWLRQHEVDHDLLVMRTPGDNRRDSVIKLELFREEVAPKYHVLGVFDDRNQVVNMWRSIGLFCAQVARGDF